MKRKKMAKKVLTVKEAYDQFQRHNLTKGLSEGTIRYYESYSRAFFKSLGDTDQPLTEVTKDEYGNALRVDVLESAIREYNHSCGVEKTSLHLFRHTYAKLFIMAGGDPFRLQKLLGHTDLSMTKRYVALYADDLKENYDSLNPLKQVTAGQKRGVKRRLA